MIKTELIKALQEYPDDAGVICRDERGTWDNIERVSLDGSIIVIDFGGGSPFSDE